MATLYWGGGTGTWDGFTVGNWYTDFARLTLSTRAPSAEDDVIFDAASNATAYTVTIANGTTVCRSCTIAGPATGDLTLAGSGAWYIYGSLTLPATGLARTFTGPLQFYGTGAQTITTNGVALASAITYAGSGTYTLQDALNNGVAAININAGTFDTNGKTVTFGSLGAPATTTGMLVLGASTVSASAFGTGGPLAISAGTSNISLSSTAASIGSPVSSTFYNVTFTGLSSLGSGASFTGNNTFNNLSFNAIGSASCLSVVLSGNQTVNGTLTISGQLSVRRYFVRSNIVGTTRTLTVGTVAALADVDFRDIAVAGASAPWSGTQLGDCGGNTNITFPAPKTVYWNGTAGGAWTSNFWAASSGGAVNFANFPLAQDTAVIDNTGLNNLATISGGAGYNVNTITSTKTNAWTLSTSPIVYGNVTLTTSTGASLFQPTFSGRVTQNLTSAGSVGSTITINGYAASVKLADNLSCGTLIITSGGLDTDNKNLTVTSAVSVSTSIENTYAFSLALGSSSISIAGAAGIASSGTGAPTMTVNAGTSTITLTNGGASFGFAGQTLTWYNVTKSTASVPTGTLYGTNTFNNLTFTAATATSASVLSFAGDQTVNGTLALGGGTSATQRLFVQSSVVGTQRTITAASVTGLSDIDFRDIKGAGAATWTGGTRIGDCGGNNGIGFDAPKTVYWNLAGTQNWSATGWATTSTGTPAANNFPLAQDTATFTDAGSAGTVTFNATYNVGTLDMSGRTSAMTLTLTNTENIYGNVTLGAGVTFSGTGTWTFLGATTQTFTTAGKSLSNPININNPSCTFRHGDAFTSTSSINVTSGSYNTQNYNITCSGVASNVALGTSRSITFGTSVITATGGAVFNFLNPAGLTFSGASSTITISGTTSKTFQGGGQTFGTVSITGGVTTSTVTVTGSNTFGTLTSTAYNYLIFTAGTTQTVTNFSYTGASGNVSRWYTSIPGQRATLTATSGAVGANSVDGGNNVGLTFTGSSPNYFYVKDIAYTALSGGVTVPVTGVQATGAVGTVIVPNVGVSVTGVSAAGAVGSVTVSEGAGITVQPTGVSATGAVGTVTIIAAQSAIAAVTGVEAAGQVGDVVATGTATAPATGVEATGAVGTVTVVEGQGVTATLTGVSAMGAVGTVTVVQGQGIVVPPTGVQATGYLGTVTVTGAANVFPVGVVGYGLIGTVNVWGLVNDIQTANWQNINNTQSSGWNQIPT